MAFCGAAAAQDVPERQAIHAKLIRNPADIALTIRYAELSYRAGDIEAAIGALERILFFEPNEPNARIYLGLLYAKLGSHDMARGYFESVLQHPATPEHIRQRAAYLLGHAERGLSPHLFVSYLRTGIRWQSNANGEPDGPYTAYDTDDDGWDTVEGNPQSDWNAYLNGGIAYAYDFGNQRGDRFEATLTTYNTRQLDFDEFHYNMAELTAGVRFGIPTGHATELATIKPFVVTSGALLGDEPYYGAGGLGLTGSLPVGKWTISPYADAVWREFSDDFLDSADTIPDEFQGATGWVYSAGLRFASTPYAATRLHARLGYERRDVEDDGTFFVSGEPFSGDYMSYDRFVVEMRLPLDIDVKGHQLLVTPMIGVRWTQYDSFDPFAQDLDNPPPGGIVEREDFQLRVGIAFDYAINDWAGVGGEISYTTTDSNLAAYDTDNFAISFGPHFRW